MAENGDMALLVTGGLGYIGSHACVALAAAGRKQLVILDNLSNSKGAALERIRGNAVRDEPEQRLSFAARSLCLELRIEPGELPVKSKATTERFETLYSEADTNNDADLDAEELAELRKLINSRKKEQMP